MTRSTSTLTGRLTLQYLQPSDTWLYHQLQIQKRELLEHGGRDQRGGKIHLNASPQR